MPSPRRLYAGLARAETVTWTLLIAGMVLKYGTETTDVAVRVFGGLHGLVFLAYAVSTVLVGIDGRWPMQTVLAGLGSAVVPFLTVPFERSAERRGLLRDRWRLLRAAPATTAERVAALALRRPRAAAVGTVLALGLVFSGLVRLGPPTAWFS